MKTRLVIKGSSEGTVDLENLIFNGEIYSLINTEIHLLGEYKWH